MLTDKEQCLKTRLDAEMDELYEIALRVQLLEAMHKDMIILKPDEEIEIPGQYFRGGEL